MLAELSFPRWPQGPSASPPPLMAQVPGKGADRSSHAPLLWTDDFYETRQLVLLKTPLWGQKVKCASLSQYTEGCVCVWPGRGGAALSEEILSHTLSRPSLWERRSRLFFCYLPVAHFPGWTVWCLTVMSDIAGVCCYGQNFQCRVLITRIHLVPRDKGSHWSKWLCDGTPSNCSPVGSRVHITHLATLY